VDLTREHAEDRPVDFCLFLRSIQASAQCGTKLNSSDDIAFRRGDGESDDCDLVAAETALSVRTVDFLQRADIGQPCATCGPQVFNQLTAVISPLCRRLQLVSRYRMSRSSGWHSCFVLGRSRVRMSTRRPAMMADSCGLRQPPDANTEVQKYTEEYRST
jgi:hypothetical protein